MNEEVTAILKNMKNLSAGCDFISRRVVKQTYFIIVCHYCMPLLHELFQNELSVAIVIPLYKIRNSKYLVNCRPVSVLPVFLL